MLFIAACSYTDGISLRLIKEPLSLTVHMCLTAPAFFLPTYQRMHRGERSSIELHLFMALLNLLTPDRNSILYTSAAFSFTSHSAIKVLPVI